MTNEEAIKILEEEAEFLYGGDEPYNKMAFDMAIEALLEPKTEWIPVSERLPKKRQVVLAIGKDSKTWDVGMFQGLSPSGRKHFWWWKKKSVKRVEYWMPKDAIPLPYRGDGE